MVLIHGTNIIVDEFKYDRPQRKSYIYFLTHFHHGKMLDSNTLTF